MAVSERIGNGRIYPEEGRSRMYFNLVTYPWFCSQSSLLVEMKGPYGMLGMEHELATCKASTLLAILSDWPFFKTTKQHWWCLQGELKMHSCFLCDLKKSIVDCHHHVNDLGHRSHGSFMPQMPRCKMRLLSQVLVKTSIPWCLQSLVGGIEFSAGWFTCAIPVQVLRAQTLSCLLERESHGNLDL